MRLVDVEISSFGTPFTKGFFFTSGMPFNLLEFKMVNMLDL